MCRACLKLNQTERLQSADCVEKVAEQYSVVVITIEKFCHVKEFGWFDMTNDSMTGLFPALSRIAYCTHKI
jgi:hypothetical protein